MTNHEAITSRQVGATLPVGLLHRKSPGGILIQLMIVTALVLAFVLLVSTGSYAAPGDLLLHNSVTTGSAKWGGSWGVSGGKYGQFTCGTCHIPLTSNIKRVRGSITAPSGTWDGPGTAAVAVVFSDTRDNTADYGDDLGGHANSNKVCEVCHSITKFHRYDTSTQVGEGGNLTHYNDQDCIRCHKHNAGFKASCDACHGNPPIQDSELVYQLDAPDDTGSRTWGEHQKHAVDLGYACNTCHNGWEADGEMPKNGDINLGFNAFSQNTGSYDGRATGNYTAGTGLTLSQTKASGTTTCAFYCHGYQLPQWSPAATADCGACHGKVAGGYGDNRDGVPDGSAGNGGKDLSGALTGLKVGKHANHLDDSFSATGDYCALCHPAGLGHTGGAIDGTVQVTLNTTYAGGSASFAGGNCSNMSCHGDAPWDSTVTGGCDFCHGGGGQYWPNGSAYPDTTGRHDKHITALATQLGITTTDDADQKRLCAYCHNDASGIGGSGHNADGGSDSIADLGSFNPIWDATNPPSVADAGSAFVPANGGCNSIACHNNTDTGSTTYGWRNAGPSTCTMCHSVDPTTDTTHVAHTGSVASYGRTIGCTDCHNATTWNSSAPATGHINGSWTIVGNSIPSYSGDSVNQTKGTCSTNDCHENGLGAAPVRNSYAWGTPLANDCASCHLGGTMASNGHDPHLASNALPNGTDVNECYACHTTTATGGGLASGSQHLDNTTDLGFNSAFRYEGVAASSSGSGAATTCSSIACHNGVTTPAWNGSVTCGSCHNTGGTGPLPGQSGVTRSHPYHADNDSDYSDCAACHTGAASYTATGGHADHQNLIVNVSFYTPDGAPAGINGSAAGQDDNGTCSTTSCHGSKTPQWGVYSEAVSGCRVCHDPTYGSYDATSSPLPPAVAQVSPTDPHTDPDGAGVTWAAGDCRGCHGGHNQGVAIALPPTSWANATGESHVNSNMKSILGFGAYSGTNINIGGPVTAPTDNGGRPQVHTAIRGKTTEAETCWGCHDALASKVSEWGFNTKTTPAGFPVIELDVDEAGDTSQESYNYGWLFTSSSYASKTSNWVAGGTGGKNPWYRSPYDNTLKQRVASVHAVGFGAAGHSSSVAVNVDGSGNVNNKYAADATLESVADIACTYCHDVHNTAGPTGKPYLRGNWVGNPYPADVPPRAGYSYPTTGGPGSNFGNRYYSTEGDWGAGVPRLYSTYNYGSTTENKKLKGGFFIDQNSNDPSSNAAMDTLTETAQLCTLCHGSSVNTMDYYTGSKLWRSSQSNGHANSTIGGTGTGKVNLFDARRGGTTTKTMGNQGWVPAGDPGCCGGNPPGTTFRPEYPWANIMNPNNYKSGRARNSGWFGSGTEGTSSAKGGDYSNWYSTSGIGSYTGTAGDKAHNFACSKCHSPHAAALPALLITNCLDASIATWSANSGNINPLMSSNQPNNCHRKESGTPGNSGWHRLNAGQELP